MNTNMFPKNFSKIARFYQVLEKQGNNIFIYSWRMFIFAGITFAQCIFLVNIFFNCKDDLEEFADVLNLSSGIYHIYIISRMCNVMDGRERF